MPGTLAVVHHIIVFLMPHGEEFFPGNPKTPVLTGTAPGDMPLVLPEGMAKKIPAGSDLIFQMHYTPNGIAQNGPFAASAWFSPRSRRSTRSIRVPVAQPAFQIPPGADNYRVEQSFDIRKDGLLLGFMPHMHLRGKDFLYEVESIPTARRRRCCRCRTTTSTGRAAYRLAEPMKLPKGTQAALRRPLRQLGQEPEQSRSDKRPSAGATRPGKK